MIYNCKNISDISWNKILYPFKVVLFVKNNCKLRRILFPLKQSTKHMVSANLNSQFIDIIEEKVRTSDFLLTFVHYYYILR